MFSLRALGLLASGITSALALGGLATYLRLLPASPTMAASVATFALCVLTVAVVVGVGTGNRPRATAYWE